MEAYEVLRVESRRWSPLGLINTRNGGVCIGPPSVPGKHDYLFCIPPPLSDDEISLLGSRLHVSLPSDLKTFYASANGFSCFGRWFNLYGLRKIMRQGALDELLEQPYDLVYENFIDLFARELRLLRISMYPDSAKVYMHSSGRIEVYAPSGRLETVFADLDSWVTSELSRFLQYVEDDGRCALGFDKIPSPKSLP